MVESGETPPEFPGEVGCSWGVSGRGTAEIVVEDELVVAMGRWVLQVHSTGRPSSSRATMGKDDGAIGLDVNHNGDVSQWVIPPLVAIVVMGVVEEDQITNAGSLSVMDGARGLGLIPHHRDTSIEIEAQAVKYCLDKATAVVSFGSVGKVVTGRSNYVLSFGCTFLRLVAKSI
jgi:hypothetical protein